MNVSATSFGIVILGLSGSVLSQVNKCTVDGRVIYQQEPCGKAGSTGGEVKMVVPSLGDGSRLSDHMEELRTLQKKEEKARREFDEALKKHFAGKKIGTPVISTITLAIFIRQQTNN